MPPLQRHYPRADRRNASGPIAVRNDVPLVQALPNCSGPLVQALPLRRILSHAQALLQAAVKKALPDSAWQVPLPRQFGSRVYGLADKTSDLDLWVDAPPEVIAVGDDVRAFVVRALRDRKISRDLISVQPSLRTLKWTEGGRHGMDVSVLLTDVAGARRALEMIAFLESF